MGPSCVSNPAVSPTDDVVGAGALDGRRDRRLVVQARHVADAHGVAGSELEAEEVLERAGQSRAPFVGGHAGELDVVDQDPAGVRLVELGEQFHQRRLACAVLADDGDDSAGGQFEIHIVQHEAIGPGISERDVLEADALGEAGGHGQVGRRDERRRRSPRARRAVWRRPSRCRAGNRSRRPWRRCRPTSATRPPAPATRRPPTHGGPRTRRRPRRRRRRRKPPRPACATQPNPNGPPTPDRTSAPTPARRSVAKRSPMPITRTSLPGVAVVAVVNR